ncbi:hypothetical protein GCM10009592_32740 [Brachybacterium rhamnosum]
MLTDPESASAPESGSASESDPASESASAPGSSTSAGTSSTGSGSDSGGSTSSGSADGSATEEPVAPPTTPDDPNASGGPIVQLLSAITQEDGNGFGRLRQVLVAALGIGFLTAAGFIGATLRSRQISGPRGHRRRS